MKSAKNGTFLIVSVSLLLPTLNNAVIPGRVIFMQTEDSCKCLESE